MWMLILGCLMFFLSREAYLTKYEMRDHQDIEVSAIEAISGILGMIFMILGIILSLGDLADWYWSN